MDPEERVLQLARELDALTPSQQGWVKAVIGQFRLLSSFKRSPKSDLITEPVLHSVGDALRIHHAFSRQALSKDRFEHAFQGALAANGFAASLAASRTNRGHDLTVDGVPISLKTEASSNIRTDMLHISKFMELGKGAWELPCLRDLFLQHMEGYDRIFQFRCLSCGPTLYNYELVEIPKALFQEARNAEFEVMNNSKQTPKPGYGYVRDSDGQLKYQLYFDGGTERKLQIKSIKKSLCVVHATWTFGSTPLE